MQVVKDGIVKDYYISKNLPKNPSMKLLNDKLEFAERLVHDRELYLKEQHLRIGINRSELNRVEDDKMRERINKSIENQRDAMLRALHDIEVEKEDLEALKGIIEMELFLGV